LPDLIHLLPESVANQIAAGEVVQRPASVVKELLENSIDAGAQNIKLVVKEAGKSFIQVVDDGCGMSETDARMSFERHATSKIFKAQDLFNIRTLGFRGEALASIASVSSVEMKTRRKEDQMATQIVIDGGELKSHQPGAGPVGTSITVKNLFYNIPVRKNFLKSDSIEFKHIMETFTNIALANPDIKLIMSTDKTEIFHLNTGSLRQRIIGLFGKKYDSSLVPVEENTAIVKIGGFIGKADQAKKTRGEQYLFVNKRFIRNPYFNHAIISAYESLLPAETFPFYTIFLEIPSDKIDVNVHPTKTEIKFEDEKAIYVFIRTAVRKSLSQYHVAPSLDFEQEAFNTQMIDPGVRKPDSSINIRIGSDYASFPSRSSVPGSSSISRKASGKEWDELYKILGDKAENIDKPLFPDSPLGNDKNNDPDLSLLPDDESQKILQLHQKYIFTTIRSGVMIISQHLAHQRILYEEFLNSLKSKQSSSQKQLFPEAIEFSPADLPILKDMLEDLESLGFIMEPFGKKAYLISGIPADIKIENPGRFIEKMLEDFKHNLGNRSIDKKELLAKVLAQNASILPGQILSREEMQMMIDKLFACENPYFSPYGKPILLKIDLGDLDKKFS
jgi:DNA mismatch repair protein MutL